MKEVETAKIDGVVEVLRRRFPDAEITTRDPGNLEPVGFTIVAEDEEPRILLVSWERFEEDQAETEKLVYQMAVTSLQPGECWFLSSDGTTELIALAPRE